MRDISPLKHGPRPYTHGPQNLPFLVELENELATCAHQLPIEFGKHTRPAHVSLVFTTLWSDSSSESSTMRSLRLVLLVTKFGKYLDDLSTPRSADVDLSAARYLLPPTQSCARPSKYLALSLVSYGKNRELEKSGLGAVMESSLRVVRRPIWIRAQVLSRYDKYGA
ncbi:hypothetical protein BS47DRAFT_1172743 [Hydnum rufescens UP504]|uniref:Uncharacterized protein n=1 Tax=Hydnum rufescens UP504 TaxID=1448309 RepID=A0A9P6ATJ5_9AGAM|nr:hypothetical protein BS47DRAFT_1172743 [Hydnum rufescens UP504]